MATNKTKPVSSTSAAHRDTATAREHSAARRLLSTLCAEYRDLQDQISPLESAKQGLMSEIRPLAAQLGIEKEVITPGAQLRRVVRTTSTILPERLLEKGVRMSVIEYATEEKVTEFYQVDKVKETGKGEGKAP